MEHYTSVFCKSRRDSAVDILDDAIKILNDCHTTSNNGSSSCRYEGLVGSHYTNDIIEVIDDLKTKIDGTKSDLISETFVEVNL